MQISSSAFENNEYIPQIFTCDGKNINPHLIFNDIPPETQTLALIMDDPDAPAGTFTHWIVWNIPSSVTNIPEGGYVESATEGINSAEDQGYTGPCPPNGTHRYFFTLYALDTSLDLPASADRNDLESDMEDHIIGEAKLMGLYQRK
jgi:Raf kinase inhibitor-like YbhB/YbcL family protein